MRPHLLGHLDRLSIGRMGDGSISRSVWRDERARGRRYVGDDSRGCAILVGAMADSATAAVVSLSLGAGCLTSVGAYWASTTDYSKTHAGLLSGLMNTGANLGGAVSPSLTPWIAAQWGWPVSLATAGGIALIGAALWLKIDPGKGLQGRSEKL